VKINRIVRHDGDDCSIYAIEIDRAAVACKKNEENEWDVLLIEKKDLEEPLDDLIEKIKSEGWNMRVFYRENTQFFHIEKLWWEENPPT